MRGRDPTASKLSSRHWFYRAVLDGRPDPHDRIAPISNLTGALTVGSIAFCAKACRRAAAAAFNSRHLHQKSCSPLTLQALCLRVARIIRRQAVARYVLVCESKPAPHAAGGCLRACPPCGKAVNRLVPSETRVSCHQETGGSCLIGTKPGNVQNKTENRGNLNLESNKDSNLEEAQDRC